MTAIVPGSSDVEERSFASFDLRDVVRDYGDFIYASLCRFGVPRADVPDALQEVLLVMHRRSDALRADASLRSWIFGITLRVAAAHRRKARHRYETELGEDLRTDPEGEAADPEASLLRADRARTLERVLSSMDLDRRAIFVMYELEELSCAQIATTLDIPLGTVHSRLHAAREDFQKAVERFNARSRAKQP